MTDKSLRTKMTLIWSSGSVKFKVHVLAHVSKEESLVILDRGTLFPVAFYMPSCQKLCPLLVVGGAHSAPCNGSVGLQLFTFPGDWQGGGLLLDPTQQRILTRKQFL